MSLENNNDSIVLDLESLSAQYKNLLIEYKQAVLNYINFLKNENVQEDSFTAIQGQAYWGKSHIKINNSQTLEECQASCKTTNGCQGATFNKDDYDEPICWLENGDTNPISASPNEYAIIPKNKQLLLIVQNINQKLISVNEQIQNKTKISQTLFNTTTETRINNNEELINQFLELTQERNRIQDLVNDYQTLDQAQIAENIKINKNYYLFWFLFFLVIIIVIISFYFLIPRTNLQSGGSNLENNAYYIVFCIFLIIFILLFYIK